MEKTSTNIIEATHGSPDHPLKIGDAEIPCYILEGDKRVLVLGGMLQALDMSQGTADKGGDGNRLAKFINTKAIREFITPTIENAILNPIQFRTTSGSNAYGYEATILADICDAVLEARKRGTLHHQQKHIADKCEILVRGFARVGIIALVDEATGFQDYRSRRALEKILEKYLKDEWAKWAKRFPDEFYKQMFRLQGWKYEPNSVKRPGVVGKYTNDIVYLRLAPGVLEELKSRTPRDDQGRTKIRYHQWLTEEVGHPKLQEHLSAVIALMKASSDWRTFIRLINRALPKYESNLEFDFYDPADGMPM